MDLCKVSRVRLVLGEGRGKRRRGSGCRCERCVVRVRPGQKRYGMGEFDSMGIRSAGHVQRCGAELGMRGRGEGALDCDGLKGGVGGVERGVRDII